MDNFHYGAPSRCRVPVHRSIPQHTGLGNRRHYEAQDHGGVLDSMSRSRLHLANIVRQKEQLAQGHHGCDIPGVPGIH